MHRRWMVAAAVIWAQTATGGWTARTSGVPARLRGVSAVDGRVAWASGADGTILRTADGGAAWQRLSIPGAEALDFRDIDAVSADTAYVLSIGSGEASRIYKTTDAGTHWTRQFTNDDAKAFFDAMAFWDANRGIAVSDSVDGRFVILTTRDGGQTWTRVPTASLPTALPNEGAFAASGTNVAVVAPDYAWIGTGAAERSRVLRSADAGVTWQISDTPVPSSASAGIFSLAFRDRLHGIAVGGDYKNEAGAVKNAAMTSDGGVTWTGVTGLGGHRSAVAYLPGTRSPAAIAVGPSGCDLSIDDGRTWEALACDGFHAVSVARGAPTAFAVGERGRIATLALAGR